MKKLELTKNQLEFLEAFFAILKKDGFKQNMSLETIKYYKHVDEPNNIFIKTELIGASRTDIGWFCLMEDASVYDLLDRFPDKQDLDWFTNQLTSIKINENINMSETEKLKLVRAYAKAWDNNDFESLKHIITDEIKFYSQFSFYDFDTREKYINFLVENITPKLKNCVTETQIGYYDGDPCLVIANIYKKARRLNEYKIQKDGEKYSFERKMSKRDSWVIIFDFNNKKISGISNCCVPTEDEVMAYSKLN